MEVDVGLLKGKQGSQTRWGPEWINPALESRLAPHPQLLSQLKRGDRWNRVLDGTRGRATGSKGPA